MALYTTKFTIPANTSEDNPVQTSLTIKEKLITKMEISFPPGCSHMVGIQIKYGIKRIWPENEGEYIYGDDETISWEEHQELPEKETELTIIGVSPGTLYDHTVLIRIMTLPTAIESVNTLLQKIYDFFRRIF